MNRTRAALFLGCALAALAAPAAARAQAFAADPTIVGGAAVIDRSVVGVDTITVNTPSAVINWNFVSPVGNPIVFLPPGTTATFQNGPNNPNFAVLNRIIPGGAPILMDGHVVSQLQTLGGGTVPGGTVVFSSPTGLVIGPKAVFDVGNLMLTTLDPTFDAATGTFMFGNTITLQPTAFADAAVLTQPGSQINAPSEGSWVALAGAQVTHAGSIRVNGSAALVGAQAANITINAGLFDIEIAAGSGQAVPIVHSGSTGGPASGAADDNHVIYMVAAPQATPITMLLSGSVGFDPAVSAAVENGAIVLSAGHDVHGTDINAVPNVLTAASAQITGGTFSSDVAGRARTDFLAGGTGGATLTFQQDVSLSGYARAHLTADAGYIATVGGNLILSAANPDPVDLGVGADVTGGAAVMRATGAGQITVAGNATIDASAEGGVNAVGLSGRGTGGIAVAEADKGNIDVTGNLVLASVGTGARDDGGAPRPVGGPGNGGTARASALNGGDLHVGGNVQVDARGIGSTGTGEMPGNGGDGTGGTGRIDALVAGTMRIDGGATVNASGIGGDVLTGPANVGGAAQGGNAQIVADGAAIDIGGPVLVGSNGTGGSAAVGGTGTGGLATVDATDGRVATLSTLQARANGSGGTANAGAGGRGGDGTGGQVRVAAHSGPTEGALTATATALAADGTGGAGASGGGGLPGGRGGDGAGGAIGATAEAGNGRLQLAAVTAQSRGIGGNGGDGLGLGLGGGRGGDGTGGSIGAGTVPGKPVGVVAGRADFASVAFTALGLGGNGAAGAPVGAGGGGTGGSVTLVSTGAPVTVTGQAGLNADGTGGTSGAGLRAPATGGAATVFATPLQNGPAGSLVIATLNATSIATGDASNLNLLGLWRVIADRSPIRIGTANLTATATGAPTVPTASEIQLPGGTVTVLTTGLFSSDGAIRLIADGPGQLIGGDLTLNSRNAITLTHSARPAPLQTVDATRFTAIATGNYDAAAGTAVFARTGVDIQAGGNAILGATNGTTALTVTAGGLARFLAPAIAQAVTVTSADIDVTAAASVGDAATNLVALQVQPNANATTLGAGAQGPGYTLTQAEAGRVQGNVVRVAALGGPAGAGPSARILVHDLALSAAAARAFEIVTPGVVHVDGALLLGNAGAANRIGISAGTRLEVATPGGSVRVRSAAGAPAGTLTVAAGDIWVGDPALLAQLAANPNFPGRDDELQDNPGADQQRGAIEADGVTLAPRNTLFVQNSGTPAAFAGITVGPGGLTLDPSGGAPASVYAFGNRLNPDGSFTNNIPFFFQVDYSFGNSAGYTDPSEFNHCLINNPKCGAPFGGIRGTTPDFFFGYFPIPPQEPPGEPLDESGIGARPLIEEPVTSGSDSTFWADPDDDDDEDEEE